MRGLPWRRWLWAGALALVVVAVGTWAAFGRDSGGTKVRYLTAQVTRGTVADTVAATGTVQPQSVLDLSFGGGAAPASGSQTSGTGAGSSGSGAGGSTAGQVVEVDVKPGAKVVKGQVLARLDDATQKSALSVAKAQLTAAQAKAAVPADQQSGPGGGASTQSQGGTAAGVGVSQARGDLASARAQQAAARQACDAQARSDAAAVASTRAALAAAVAHQLEVDQDPGSTPAQRTQAAQAALRAQRAADAASARQEGDSRDCADRQRAAAAQVATAQAAVAQASRSSSTPVAASVTSTTSAAGLAATLAANDAAVAQAQAAVDQAQAAVDATVLHAPVDGLVQVVNVVEDAVPPSGAAIQERSDTLTVQANVAEQDVTQVKGGQKAQVTLPALGTTESATVAGLPSQANAAPSSASAAASTAVTFPVTLTFDQSDPAILPGMSAQLEIALVRHANVLQVPTTAVQGGANGSTVQVLQDGRPVTRPVEVGLSTETATEIVVGLREGQTVVTGVVNPTQGATQPTTGGGGFGGGGGARGGGFGGGGGLGGGGARGGGGG